MADLITGDVMNEAPINVRATSNGGNGGSRGGRSGSAIPYSASGVRGPRDVMRDREAREARKRAESEARQREQQEEENRRRAQEERRRSAERRTAAAGVGGVDDRTSYPRPSGYEVDPGSRQAGREKAAPANVDRPQGELRPPGGATRVPQGHQPDITAPGPDRMRGPSSDSRNLAAAGASTGASGRVASGGSSRPQGPAATQHQQKPARPQQTSAASNVNRTTSQPPQPKPVPTTGQQGASAASQPGPRGVSSEGAPSRNPNVSSFPHAFERWETLSSHWEGLTSYWIRRLEQNKDEVGREPLAQQMARQITDLSAAGANLFHAVVELQRLRASSERKFQRWFFETRAEQERAQEMQAELENSLRQERQQRGELLQTAARLEAEKAQADKMVAEMKRELQISKEEARRAWEELGRREQEERERTNALRDGQPTVMGGIQVVPMLQAGTGRYVGENRPPTREGPSYAGGVEDSPVEGSPVIERLDEYRAAGLEDPFLEPPPRSAGRYTEATGEAQPAVTNGVAPTGRSRMADPPASVPISSLPPTSTSMSSRAPYAEVTLPQSSVAPTSFYQHQGTSLQGPGQIAVPRADNRSVLSHPSEGTVSEEEYEYDEHGSYRVDAEGRPILYRRGVAGTSEGGGEYGGHYGGVSGAAYGSGSTATSSPLRGGVTGTGWSGGPADYSGSGYGSVWESVPRHHHPTRLSDVLEEDERSRTSPSRGSLRSGR